MLEDLLQARSIAIVGASENPLKPTGRTLRYLRMHGFAGTVYPVNPTRDTVQGLPCWPSVAALPAAPDLAVIALPAASVIEAVRACGQRGVPVAIVYSSGFDEVGGAGEDLQAELAQVAREHGIRVLGPNTNGVIGATGRVTATFMSGIDDETLALRDDGIAFVTQSGAMGGFIVRQAQLAGLGIGTFVATGNEMDLSLPELIDLLVEAPTTRTVLAYVEGIRDPDRFRAALARARDRGVPVVVMKVGRSEVGAAAAATHTGAVAGSDGVFDGLLRQHGAARAHDIDHLLDLGRIFALGRPPRGRRLSVVTLSGGAGVLVSDAAADLGIEVPRWDDEWAAQLQAVLPEFAAVRNPIDTTGALVTDPTLLTGALEVMGRHPETDVILVVAGNMQQQEAEVCDIIAQAAAATDTLVVTVWIGGSGTVPGLLADRGLPAFSEPVRAVRAIAALMDAAGLPVATAAGDDEQVAPPPADADGVEDASGVVIDEVAVKQVLARHGVPTVPEEAVSTAAQAVDAAERVGYPVVLKLLSSEVAHKSELGAVRVGLADAGSVRTAADEIVALATARGVADIRLVVQQMVSAETELILGMRRDPTFGPVIVLGIGGTLTEVVQDVQVRVPPLVAADVEQMCADLRFSELLDGPRGRAPVDRAALTTAVLAFAQAVTEEGVDWESAEVNPLLIDGQGRPVAVDALAIRRAPGTGETTIEARTSPQEAR
ncbi:acetate--CoA ligase family protein [Ornithinimicrobium faecis]|uniref:acetate--CoA ligase family protein n=1 Tax=Ornithinimicrobium faecis TaxID=2934158 RepID=UPI002118240A|nr:acetate--CoA ligase family protein [Ornithinimicrobium sp. HY1745]